MEGILIFVIGASLFALTALRWAIDSTEGVNSAEWARRKVWPGR